QLGDNPVSFGLRDSAADQGVDRTLEFTLGSRELALQVGGLCPSRCGCLTALRSIQFDEISDRLARPRFVARPINDAALDIIEILVAAVLAGAAFVRLRAYYSRALSGARDRHAAATTTAA